MLSAMRFQLRPVSSTARRTLALRSLSSSIPRFGPVALGAERTNNKVWASADEAIKDIQNGSTIFSGVSPFFSTPLPYLFNFTWLLNDLPDSDFCLG